MALYCVVAKIGKNMLRPASSPVARDHFWGIFELIIQESGDEESDGKGRKKKQFPLGQALYAHFHHPPLALLACLQLSRILRKASGGDSTYTKDYFYQWNF